MKIAYIVYKKRNLSQQLRCLQVLKNNSKLGQRYLGFLLLNELEKSIINR